MTNTTELVNAIMNAFRSIDGIKTTEPCITMTPEELISHGLGGAYDCDHCDMRYECTIQESMRNIIRHKLELVITGLDSDNDETSSLIKVPLSGDIDDIKRIMLEKFNRGEVLIIAHKFISPMVSLCGSLPSRISLTSGGRTIAIGLVLDCITDGTGDSISSSEGWVISTPEQEVAIKTMMLVIDLELVEV